VRWKIFEYYDAKRCEAAHDDYVRQEAIEKERASRREQLAALDQQIAAKDEQHRRDQEQLATLDQRIRYLEEEIRRLRGQRAGPAV
jgi:septal ring factor EnvC (AmiA/AmiB activator)